jgi:phage gp29-like protein
LKLLIVKGLDGNSVNGLMNGCHLSLIWAYFFKNYGIKDWSVFIEKFAIPAVIATRPALMNNKADIRALELAVENFTHLFAAVLPEGCKLEFPSDTNKSSSSDVFKNYAEYWNNQVSIRVLGQILTSGVGKTGSLALGQVHNAVREDLMTADMLIVKGAANEQIKRLCDMNFPSLKDYPMWKFKEEVNIDYKVKRSEIAKNLFMCGYQIKKEDGEKEFEFALTDKPATAVPPPAGQAGKEFISNFIKNYFESVKS